MPFLDKNDLLEYANLIIDKLDMSDMQIQIMKTMLREQLLNMSIDQLEEIEQDIENLLVKNKLKKGVENNVFSS